MGKNTSKIDWCKYVNEIIGINFYREMRANQLFKFNNRPTIFVKQLSMGIHGPINVSVIKITEVKITSNVD